MARRASRSASRFGYRRQRSLGCRRTRACALAEHRDLGDFQQRGHRTLRAVVCIPLLPRRPPRGKRGSRQRRDRVGTMVAHRQRCPRTRHRHRPSGWRGARCVRRPSGHDCFRGPGRTLGGRISPRRAPVSRYRRPRTVGGEAVVPGTGCAVRLRSAFLFRRHAVRSSRPESVGGERRGSRARDSFPCCCGSEKPGVDDRDASVAWCGHALDRAARVGAVSPCGRSRRLFRTLCRRGIRQGPADRIPFRGIVALCLGCVLGQFQVQAQGFRQQALLLVSLRPPRRMAPAHADAVRG